MPKTPPKAVTSYPDHLTVPLHTAPVDVTLPYPIYVRIHGKLVVLRNVGDVLTEERVKQLEAKRVEAVFIAEADWRAYTALLEKGLDEAGLVRSPEPSVMGLRNLLNTYWESVDQAHRIEPGIFSKLKELTAKMPIAMSENRKLADFLVRRDQSPEAYFSNHSINVAVYSVALGMKLGMALPQLQDLAFAGCLVNIGIIQVSRSLLYKPGALLPEEWSQVKQHPRIGAEVLKLLLVPSLVWEAALQHCERYDGTGYPFGLKGREISLFARIISIAEAFSALTSLRPWAAAVTPVKAVEIMTQMKGKFDPDIFITPLTES